MIREKLFLLLIILFFSVDLYAVHNFTINGAEEVTLSLDDTMNIYFEYENIGNSATLEVSLDISGNIIPLIEPLDSLIQDGGVFDSTGVDGIFQRTMGNRFSASNELSIVVELTDEGISDEVTINFEPLLSDFSISGKVEKETTIGFNIPVPYAFVYTLYNSNISELIDIIEDFDILSLIQYLEEDRYILTGTTDILGTYTINIPDTIPHVNCLVGVYSIIDMSDESVRPGYKSLAVNGNITEIDFLYKIPDGKFQGIVKNENDSPIPHASIIIHDDDTLQTKFYSSDSLGNFSIPLLNGTYSIDVFKIGYHTYNDTITIDNGNLYLEIILERIITEVDEIYNNSNMINISIYPNPFHRKSNLSFSTHQTEQVNFSVYNIKGEKIKAINNIAISNENQRFFWDGKNSKGDKVSPGIYFYKIQIGNKTVIKKALLLE